MLSPAFLQATPLLEVGYPLRMGSENSSDCRPPGKKGVPKQACLQIGDENFPPRPGREVMA